MKRTFLRNTVMASVFIAALSLASCKDKTETEVENDTIENNELDASPMDTVVTENDTVVETGTGNDSSENPVGTQVP